MMPAQDTPAPFSLGVYCGSREGYSPEYLASAQACGESLARRGWQLVYGGGSTGMMGRVADAALEGGSSVIGVIPHRLIQRELGHPGLTTLEVVGSMHERKHRMAQQSDAFVALPGGIGTMEELFEIWTWRQLGYHRKPLGLLNVGGFYDDLLRFIERCQSSGFLWPDVRELLLIDDNVERLLDRLSEQAAVLKAQTPPDEPEQATGGVVEGT